MIRPNRRAGFTILEMLAAIVLASMLMAAVLGVLRTATLQTRELSAKYPVHHWKRAFSAQLDRDLASARRIAASPEHLRLIGYGGSDFVRGEATLRPTEIIYEIVAGKDRTWLVRREIHLDALEERNSRSELVATNISALHVERLRQRRAGVYVPEEISAKLSAIPSRVRVALRDDQSDEPVFSQTFVLSTP